MDYFGVQRAGSSVRTEVVAGVTTFMTMAYIIFVNPSILQNTGMDFNAVMMATVIAAGVSTLLMGIFARLPFALAPGMGLNAFFAFTVCLGMGLPWQVALGAVFIDGVLFLILSILPVREGIIKSIPLNLKLATSVGIGLFIAFIGFSNAGIVVADEATKLALGDITHPRVMLSLVGLLLMGILMAFRVKGALLWGIIATSVISWISGISVAPQQVVAWPDFSQLSHTFLQMDVLGAFRYGLLAVVFTFTFVDLFDTLGTFMGLAAKLGMVNEKGTFPGAGRGLLVDSIGTILGAILGTSTVTTYVESASGVSEGGKTGLTAVVCGLLFLLALFFVPLAGAIPAEATAPALVIVGLLMMEPILSIDFREITEALPAFLAIVLMPLTYSISEGLIFGVLSYTIINLLAGKYRKISPVMYILSAIFIIRYLVV
ncbi:MAG: adenine/guanine/hypoxanthine permease [Candidatus Atribacteria bacterium]|nr:adenine/guanine/hypoxanthine permease [Candidatus Atribacteria bacterium]